jgi:uncharacterized protein YacL
MLLSGNSAPLAPNTAPHRSQPCRPSAHSLSLSLAVSYLPRFGSIVAIVLMCALREFLALYRAYEVKAKRAAASSSSIGLSREDPNLSSSLLRRVSYWQLLSLSDVSSQLFESFSYLVSLVLAYLLMLVVMSYNVSLFLIICLGCAVSNGLIAFAFKLYLKKKKVTAALNDENGSSDGVAVEADHCCDSNVDID